MGFSNFFKKATEAFSGSALNEGLTEIDPTNPDADYGEVTRLAGDATLNYITNGAAGTAFSDGSQFIQDANEVTDNTFTVNNIEDMTSDYSFDMGDISDFG